MFLDVNNQVWTTLFFIAELFVLHSPSGHARVIVMVTCCVYVVSIDVESTPTPSCAAAAANVWRSAVRVTDPLTCSVVPRGATMADAS